MFAVVHVKVLRQHLLDDFIAVLGRIICIVMSVDVVAVAAAYALHYLVAKLQLFVKAFGNVIGKTVPRCDADFLPLSFILLLLIDSVVVIIIII